MRDAILGVLVLVCIAFAFGLEYVAYTAKSHAVTTDALAGGALFLAVGLAFPTNLANIANTARRVLPWADRRRAERLDIGPYTNYTPPRATKPDDLPDVKPR